MMNYSLADGLIVERLGDDLMVIVPGRTDVVSLSGRPAKIVIDLQAGTGVEPSEPALRDLVDLGVITAPGLSRRGLIKVGAAGAGASIAVLAMPGVAAASSSPVVSGGVRRFDVGQPDPSGPDPVSQVSLFFTPISGFPDTWSGPLTVVLTIEAASQTWRFSEGFTSFTSSSPPGFVFSSDDLVGGGTMPSIAALNGTRTLTVEATGAFIYGPFTQVNPAR